jgi:indolepyruvate ferredoxin oxidoreductase
VRRAEAALPAGPAGEGLEAGRWPLTEAVARGLFKLMSYKDEYEVARQYANPAFLARLREQFEGDYHLRFHLAPPLLARRNAAGELVKRPFGPWLMPVFRVLAGLRGLRGTVLDPFGHTAERRWERELIVAYERTVDELLAGLTPVNRGLAAQIAAIPESIRGFGHVKARNGETAKAREQELLARFRSGQGAEPAPQMREVILMRQA